MCFWIWVQSTCTKSFEIALFSGSWIIGVVECDESVNPFKFSMSKQNFYIRILAWMAHYKYYVIQHISNKNKTKSECFIAKWVSSKVFCQFAIFHRHLYELHLSAHYPLLLHQSLSILSVYAAWIYIQNNENYLILLLFLSVSIWRGPQCRQFNWFIRR